MTHVLRRAHLLSTALGVVMAAAAGIHTAGVLSILSIVTVIAVLAGTRIRVAATLAVLLAAAAVMFTDTSTLATGLAGLSGAGYLILRHTDPKMPILAGLSSPAMPTALACRSRY